MHEIKSMTETNAPTLLAMQIRRYGAKRITQYGRSRATVGTTGHRNRVSGHRFRRKKMSCGIVKLLFEVSVQKARNGPSTQLVQATSCVERSNTMIKDKEHS
jgi:hypothetical protein